MARLLFERFQWARELVQMADRLSDAFGAVKLSRVMFPPTDQALDNDQIETWRRELSLTKNAQPAICLTSILWCRFLKKLGIAPVAAGGHSLGELLAFYVAGAFDEASLLRFAYQRGAAMSTPTDKSGAMLSIKGTRSQVEKLLRKITDGYAVLANINAPNQMVVGGELNAINQLSRLAKDKGLTVQVLPVSNAFHCKLTLPAADTLAHQAILPGNLTAPKVRLFSSVIGQEISKGLELKKHFVKQVTTQVDFVTLVENIARCSDIMIEVGPGRVLCGLVDAILPNRETPCLPVESSPLKMDDLNFLIAQLYVTGQTINWDALYSQRLVYPFIPAADRAFISNPCENLTAFQYADNSIGLNKEPSQPAALPFELPDLSQETFRMYLQKRGSFLSEFIKVDMKHALSEYAAQQGDSLRQNESDEHLIMANPESDDSIDLPGIEILFSLVEETTGFARETLTRDSRLLDDLNLDSIKSGDLIAQVFRKLRTFRRNRHRPMDKCITWRNSRSGCEQAF